MKNYRVAIVGCRARGSGAAKAYGSHPRIELVGLFGPLNERLNELGDAAGVSARFNDFIKDDLEEKLNVPPLEDMWEDWSEGVRSCE